MNLYFDDLRFKMSFWERFLIRIINYSFYAILIAAAVVFLSSDVKQLFWLGVLMALFLADRFFHFNKAALEISSIKQNAKKINTANYLSPASFEILERAHNKSSIIGNNFYLLSIKLLSQLPQIKNCLTRLDIEINDFEKKIDELLINKTPNEIKFPEAVATLANAAFLEANAAKNDYIEPTDLFVALANVNDLKINQLLSNFEIKAQNLRQAIIYSRFSHFSFNLSPSFLPNLLPRKIRRQTMNRAWTSKPTPILDQFSIDLTDLARAGKIGLLIGRQKEYDRLVDVLSRPTKPNALLIGEPGVGKKAIISALAFNIIRDKVPEQLFDKRLVLLRIDDLTAGAKIEEVSNRLKKISNEIIESGNIILYITDIHNLNKISAEKAASAADFLLPIIRNDAFQFIGATYPREFKIFIEPQTDFASAFEIIQIEEMSEDDATQILTYESLILEKQNNITICVKAIRAAVEMAHRYERETLLPESAKDLLKEVMMYVKNQKKKKLTEDDVITVMERKINIPIHRADKSETEKLLNLENIIHQSLIDQETAVKAVSQAMREYRSGLSRKGGPIAVFLFVGPTGVGKTELAKILAQIQFGSEGAMVRFDMSEYQTKESINEFIGTPDGKISGALTETIRQKPFSLILLDEFEKAHLDLLNLFLPVFDDGRLTDNTGRVIDFTNTIIIATSNALSDFIKEEIEAGKPMEQISGAIKSKLTSIFRPELLNRFSQIVAFNNLSMDNVIEIAKLQLKSLAKTLTEQGIELEFSDEAVLKIAEIGYDPVFGARPLRQTISEKIRSVLAEKILKGEIAKGQTVKIIFVDNNFQIL